MSTMESNPGTQATEIGIGSARPMARSAATTASALRERYVDVFRGLLIAHMALDHASLFFNPGRPGEELASAAPAIPADFWQFLVRFLGVPVAPGFFFMAGFMVALTSFSREARGMSPQEVTRKLIVRGCVLIAVDALIMGLPRAAMGFYSFMVLTSIGASLILLALLRHLPNRVLLAAALAILVLHPLIDVSALPVALQAVLHEPIREGAFRSLYPLLPWCALPILGFVVGRDSLSRARPQRFWLLLAGASLAVFLLVRLAGGYGNAYPYERVASLEFWSFAKYPPDLPFIAWSCAVIFALLALLRQVTRDRTSALLQPFAVFGRVPFFFYVVHFYLLGLTAAITGFRTGLAGTCLIWMLLLIVMVWPCRWFADVKARRRRWWLAYL
jgi:uncharacterized membrane protein